MIAFESGTISTIAGGNGGGYSGDNGPATSAQLSYPNGVTVDGYLNVYIADSFNNVVRKVTPSGTITTIAGGGSGCSGETDTLGDGCPGTNGSFNYTATVRMDGEGSVIITDYYNNAIHKLTPEGTLQLVAGLGSGCSGQTDSWGDGCLANQINIYQPWGRYPLTCWAMYLSATPATASFARLRLMARSRSGPEPALRATAAMVDRPPAHSSTSRKTVPSMRRAICMSRILQQCHPQDYGCRHCDNRGGQQQPGGGLQRRWRSGHQCAVELSAERHV